jgi:ribonuclease-3
MTNTDFLLFEQRLGYQFQQKKLIELALTHSSFGLENNERLEFLGDGLLGALVAHLLFEQHPKADEGLLSRARAVLVREDSLARIAQSIGIAPLLRLSSGEHQLKGREKPSILADAFEAVIAAIFLESGFESLKTIITRHFGELTRTIELGEPAKDAKSILQEWLQKQGFNPPIYQLEQKTGQDHAGQFLVSCSVPALKQQTQAWGSNKRIAEQAAAALMLENSPFKQLHKTTEQKKISRQTNKPKAQVRNVLKLKPAKTPALMSASKLYKGKI